MTTLTTVEPATQRSVEIEGSIVTANLCLNDPSAAQFLLSKPPEARLVTAESALGVGLRALASADTTITEHLLDEKLKGTLDRLGDVTKQSLARASDEFAQRWRKHVDDDLSARLQAHREALSAQFRVLFDAANDGSVQKSIVGLLTGYETRIKSEMDQSHAAMRRELADALRGTADPDHPMSRLHAELTSLRQDVAAHLEASRAALAGAKLVESRPQAGHDYEALIHKVIADLVRACDDEVERMGRRPGATGGAEGDIVIGIDPKLTRGLAVRVAVEVTTEAKLTVTALKRTMGKANADRGARRAVIVINDPSVLGGQRLAIFEGLGAVAVYRPDDPPEFAALSLQVALRHARAVAVQESMGATEERDEGRIAAAVSKAKAALEAIDTIVGNQTKVAVLADSTVATARKLSRCVTDCLNDIDTAVHGESHHAS